MKVIDVVGAIIVNDDGEIFITRRGAHKNLSGFYEFPGGKVDVGETDQEALKRELMEELSVLVHVEDFYQAVTHQYDFGTVHLKTYICRLIEAVDIQVSTDHDKMLWVSPRALNQYEFTPADVDIIERLKHENFHK